MAKWGIDNDQLAKVDLEKLKEDFEIAKQFMCTSDNMRLDDLLD